jgi:hypothetical protein
LPQQQNTHRITYTGLFPRLLNDNSVKEMGTTMKRLLISLILASVLCGHVSQGSESDDTPYLDKPFIQEYHEAFPSGKTPVAKNIRSIAVDKADNIWIATAAGVFVKPHTDNTWKRVVEGDARGPAYAVAVDDHSGAWVGTWDGVYRVRENHIEKHDAVKGPISAICNAHEGVYCLGPQGIWLYTNNKWKKKITALRGLCATRCLIAKADCGWPQMWGCIIAETQSQSCTRMSKN